MTPTVAAIRRRPSTAGPAGRRCSKNSFAAGSLPAPQRPCGPPTRSAASVVRGSRTTAHQTRTNRRRAARECGRWSGRQAPRQTSAAAAQTRDRAARSPRRRRTARTMFGGPSKAQNIRVIRRFSRTWAIVSTPLPTQSRYATSRGPSTRSRFSPLGDRFTCPDEPDGAVATKNICWRSMKARTSPPISAYCLPMPVLLRRRNRLRETQTVIGVAEVAIEVVGRSMTGAARDLDPCSPTSEKWRSRRLDQRAADTGALRPRAAPPARSRGRPAVARWMTGVTCSVAMPEHAAVHRAHQNARRRHRSAAARHTAPESSPDRWGSRASSAAATTPRHPPAWASRTTTVMGGSRPGVHWAAVARK